MDKEYYHKLKKIEKLDSLLYMPISHIVSCYKQPDWCGKHDALNGIFGCNKLLNNVTSIEDCINCKDCKDETNK